MVWMPHWPLVSERGSMKLGMERINSLLNHVGSPHNNMPPVIQVAGTNGKGSTIAFLKSIFESYGLKVHAYNSPHLKRFNERITIAGEEISDSYLYELLEECRIAADTHNIDVSFFEGVTAAAFLAFSRNKADICLVEVGLGGRLDATNVFVKPLLSIITPISYDHMQILGDTIEKIAYEKACIMKTGVPCVIGAQTDEASKVFEDYANEHKVPLYRFEYDFGIEPEVDGSFIYHSEDCKAKFPEPRLAGLHQYLNAVTAIAAVKLLRGIEVSDDIIAKGISTARWAGRIQKIDSGKLFDLLPENSEVILDGAHNESGAQALSTWMTIQPKMKTYMIFGMTLNREPKDFIKYFTNHDVKIVPTTVLSEPMSFSGKDLAKRINLNYNIKKTAGSIEEALETVSGEGDQPVRVIVCGSLFLVGDFLISN